MDLDGMYYTTANGPWTPLQALMFWVLLFTTAIIITKVFTGGNR